jgi:hypothetical protein
MNSTSLEEIAANSSVVTSKKKAVQLPTAEEQEDIKEELSRMSEEELSRLIASFNATYLKYMAKEIGDILSIKNYSGISASALKNAVLDRMPLVKMMGVHPRDMNSVILSLFLLKKEKGSLAEAAKPKAKSKLNTFLNSIRAMNMPAEAKQMMINQAMKTFAKEEKAVGVTTRKVAAATLVKPVFTEEEAPAPVAKPVARKTVKKAAVANSSLTEEEQKFYDSVAHLTDVPEDVKIAYAKVKRDKIKNPVIVMHDGSYIITSIRKTAELKVSPDNFVYPTYGDIQKINAKSFGVLKKSLGIATPPGGGTGTPVRMTRSPEMPTEEGYTYDLGGVGLDGRKVPDIYLSRRTVPQYIKKSELPTVPEAEEIVEEVFVPTKRKALPKKPTGAKGMEGGKRKTRRGKKHGSKTRKGRK